jgi:hypothetical protein
VYTNIIQKSALSKRYGLRERKREREKKRERKRKREREREREREGGRERERALRWSSQALNKQRFSKSQPTVDFIQ